MRLEGKVVIVAGAGDNMGRAIPVLFAQEGARLVLVSRNEAALAQTAALAREAGGPGSQVETLVADVTQEQTARQAVELARQRFGGVDGLVNNAGGFFNPKAQLSELAPETWDQALRNLLRGAYLFARQAAPAMAERGGGSIVNVSAAPITRISGGTAYAAGKEGLAGLTRQLARELWASNIRVNCISPGFIWLPWNEPRVRPLRRSSLDGYGTGPDVAYAALWLISDESSWVTGIDVAIDGGDAACARAPERRR